MTSVPLFYEEHGVGPGRDDIVLIAGQAAHLTDWYPEIIATLVEQNFHVTTLDNRDVGLSPHMEEAGRPDLMGVYTGAALPPYSLENMAEDVVQLIEKLDLKRPMVLAHSLGSMVAQCVALSRPELVSAMVLIAGTTGDRAVGQPRADIAAELAGGPSIATAGISDSLEKAVASSSRWASWDLDMTNELLRKRLSFRLERGPDGAGPARQIAAVLAASDRTEALCSLRIPTIVIHGSDDPLVSVSGGQALAAAIPDAELMIIEHLAHDMPPSLWPIIVDAVVRVRDRRP